MQIVGYQPGPTAGAETTTDGDTDDKPAAASETGADAAASDDPASAGALLIATGETVERVSLAPGRTLDYRLETRHCAGSLDGAAHEPCEAPTAPYCPEHTDRWPCARCTGNCNLPLPNCREEHAVYLAGFRPDTFKIGVTKAWRLETRLREQGADRGAHLRTVADGRIARQIEADVASEVGDSVRVAAKIRGLHQPFDEGAWEGLLAAFDHLATYTFDYGLALSDRPMQETLASGHVRGTKGRVLVLENAGSTYAVDLRDLVGYEVESGGGDRNLQASLGAWE